MLFGIWAMAHKEDHHSSYIGQVWNAVNYYQSLLSSPSILTGDFNSNQIWDKKSRVGTNAAVVNFLKQFKIESLYHKQNDEKHGQEQQMTFFLHRNINKPYHIDYAFASAALTQNGFHIHVGSHENWLHKSELLPLILEIEEF